MFTYRVWISSLLKTWKIILEQNRKIAKRHMEMAQQMEQDSIENIKKDYEKKEEARKKHLLFVQQLLKERNELYAQRDQFKEAFDVCSGIVYTSQSKQESEKSNDKLKRQWHQEILNMNNAKVTYFVIEDAF